MQWQPIETAPTDGTTIIGREADSPEGVFSCAWCGGDWLQYSTDWVHPAYWMPMPDAPDPSKEKL